VWQSSRQLRRHLSRHDHPLHKTPAPVLPLRFAPTHPSPEAPATLWPRPLPSPRGLRCNSNSSLPAKQSLMPLKFISLDPTRVRTVRSLKPHSGPGAGNAAQATAVLVVSARAARTARQVSPCGTHPVQRQTCATRGNGDPALPLAAGRRFVGAGSGNLFVFCFFRCGSRPCMARLPGRGAPWCPPKIPPTARPAAPRWFMKGREPTTKTKNI